MTGPTLEEACADMAAEQDHYSHAIETTDRNGGTNDEAYDTNDVQIEDLKETVWEMRAALVVAAAAFQYRHVHGRGLTPKEVKAHKVVNDAIDLVKEDV